MCCVVDLQSQEEFIRKNKNNHRIRLYKILSVRNETQLNEKTWTMEEYKFVTGPYKAHFRYKPGINKSDARAGLRKINRRAVSHGIHCFTNRYKAIQYGLRRNDIIVSVYADIDDLIGVGYGHAVFKKITLTKSSYERVLNKKVI